MSVLCVCVCACIISCSLIIIILKILKQIYLYMQIYMIYNNICGLFFFLQANLDWGRKTPVLLFSHGRHRGPALTHTRTRTIRERTGWRRSTPMSSPHTSGESVGPFASVPLLLVVRLVSWLSPLIGWDWKLKLENHKTDFLSGGRKIYGM